MAERQHIDRRRGWCDDIAKWSLADDIEDVSAEVRRTGQQLIRCELTWLGGDDVMTMKTLETLESDILSPGFKLSLCDTQSQAIFTPIFT